jgi:aminoglycoside phosphotransferase (APT) family kinase protein
MLTHWVCGKAPELTFEAGYTVGKILKKLHSIKLPGSLKPFSIKDECNRKILAIKLKNVQFPHKDEILEYVKQNSHLARDNYSLAHLDVHLRNFLVDKRGNYFLIDYENLAITDPWMDLSYAAIFHTEEKDDFWYSVLMSYFDGDIPKNFWKVMRYYCHLHLLKLILGEHDKGLQEQIDYKANLIWDTFNCHEENVPLWFEKYKKD